MSNLQHASRRSFLKLAAGAAAAGLVARPARALQPAGANDRLAVAFIGVGGKGTSNLEQVSGHDATEVVALCDIDTGKLGEAAGKHPDAKTFADYREMFEAMKGKVDAVVVSTPDHTHAPASMEGLNRGLHVYCEKPLTHDIYEARQLAKIAAQQPSLSTQMGTQHNSGRNKRQGMALLSDPDLREKTVGRVRAVYGWSDRPAGWWPQGVGKPDHSDPVPDGVSWDLWLGTAPTRDFVNGMYHPFNWRGAFDFGCGALGDMACHILDVPFYGLDLGMGTSVVCHAETGTDDRFPIRQHVVTTFPGSDASDGAPIPIYWSDGGVIPHYRAIRVAPDFDVTENATVIVGDKGSLHVAHPDGEPTLFVEKDGNFVREDIASMLPSFDRRNHYHHWVDVALGRDKETACRFQKSGPMTEALCLGSISARFPHETLMWDADAMKFADHPEADKLVKRDYRDGFKVKNL